MATWTPKIDHVDKILAADINALQTLKADIQKKTAANLGTLDEGEFGLETDTRRVLMGSSMGNQVIKGDYITPEQYGAKADGGTDDTVAIQAALTAASTSGTPIQFSDNTYIIGPVGTNPKRCLALAAGIKISGAGIGKTIIKVKNSAGSYCWLMNGAAGVDLTGLEVNGITFDHNIANNALPSGGAYSMANDANITIAAYAGTDISIHDCEIKNASSVNNIVVNGTTCKRVKIYNIVGNTLGDDPNSISHDASIIYTHATDVSVYGCLLESSGTNDPGAITGIETHGSNTAIFGNTIKNFKIGMNITGSFESDTTNVSVYGNNISGALFGIALWSITGTGHASGYGLDGVGIFGNTIILAGNPTWGAAQAEGGIIIHGDVSVELDARGINICGNVISHPLEGAEIANSNSSCGIGWISSMTPLSYLKDTVIANNTIINFPMAAIRLSCKISNVKVDGNILVNCGTTQWASVIESYRSPIFVGSTDLDGCDISNNLIADTTATIQWLYGINAANSASQDFHVIDNVFSLTGTKQGGFLFYLPQNANSTFYLQSSTWGFGSYKTSGATQQYALGSMVTDSSNGTVYQIGSDQYTWNDITSNQPTKTTSGPTFDHLHLTNALNVGGDVLIASGKVVKVNAIQVVGAQAAAQDNLKADYTTGNLDTEAEIIAALNATNAAFNTLLAKQRTHGLIAT